LKYVIPLVAIEATWEMVTGQWFTGLRSEVNLNQFSITSLDISRV
jgi:hypothetical protein